MRSNQVKTGRNELCPCGSGKKYKKCCFELINHAAFQESRHRLTEQLGMLQAESELKMSEIILHLAAELLEAAKTKSQQKFAIFITCIAWNLAVIHQPKDRSVHIERIVTAIDNEEGQEEVRSIINSILEKKDYFYLNVRRVILKHEVLGNKNNFHLNVVSTTQQDA